MTKSQKARDAKNLRRRVVRYLDRVSRERDLESQLTRNVSVRKLQEAMGMAKPLEPRAYRAWDSYRIGVQMVARGSTDRKVYEWLEREHPEGLTAFVTWSRNLRRARLAYAQQKHVCHHAVWRDRFHYYEHMRSVEKLQRKRKIHQLRSEDHDRFGRDNSRV